MPRQVVSIVRGVNFRNRGLQLGKDLFDRIEVGRVAGQEEQLGAGGADQAAYGLTLVAAKIIHDDNIARAQGGGQELLDPPLAGAGGGAKAGAVDRPVDDTGRGDAVVAQRRQKQPAPAQAEVSVCQRLCGTLATRRAPRLQRPAGGSCWSWRRTCPGEGRRLVDEHQALGVKPALIRLPPGPAASDVGAILFAGRRFFLNVIPSCLKKRHTAP
jgi:hypothetical protein